MTIDIPQYIILGFAASFLCMPLFFNSLFSYGLNPTTEPNKSRSDRIMGMQFLIFAVVFGLGRYDIFAGIMGTLGILVSVHSSWNLYKYNKAEKLAKKLKDSSQTNSINI